MKPNTKQLSLIQDIAAEIASWSKTNDISSPSHWNLIEEFVKYQLDVELNEEDTRHLADALSGIMEVIRNQK